MGAISTRPITIEEFEKLDPPENRNWELHNGEVVEVPFASLIHKYLQHRILYLLMQAFPHAVVLIEFPFQVESTNDERSADVGLTTKERGQASLARGVLTGAPELVAEILSPSNSVLKLKQYRHLCFEHGTNVFLTVDPDDNTVEVHFEADRQDSVLRVGNSLRLSLFGGQQSIPVAAIFAGITLPETS
jgi:Uma2 family endonuclease